jgi:hypothetical protein
MGRQLNKLTALKVKNLKFEDSQVISILMVQVCTYTHIKMEASIGEWITQVL